MCETERSRGSLEIQEKSACGSHGSAGLGREKETGTDSTQGLLPYMPLFTHTVYHVFVCLFSTVLSPSIIEHVLTPIT